MKKFCLVFFSTLLCAGCAWWSTPNTVDPSLTCGGIAGLTCPDGYVCYTPESVDYPDAAGQCIPEYVDYDIDATVCPVNGPFEVGVDSENQYCVCPDGYEKNSDVIGYETCYGGAECPILEVECVQTEETAIEVGPTEDD
jgi:hypothetical protein